MRAAVIVAATSLAFLCAAAPTVAQPAPRDEQVVVVGAAPTREAVRHFVEEMAIASRTTDQLARWDRKICPGIAGLRTQYARFVIDRMAQRAFDIGLDVGAPGCNANVLIVVTPNPDAIANELVTRHPTAMGLLRIRGRTSLGRTAARNFVESDAPVRWWHVNRTHTRDGFAVKETFQIPRGIESSGAPVLRLSGNLSRLNRTTRQDFAAAMIIVDANALGAIAFNWDGLADYLAMVTLSQLDPDADTSGYPTILNIFGQSAGGESVRAMTDWDVAYLRGLYDTTREARSVNVQESEIASSMGRDLNPRPARN